MPIMPDKPDTWAKIWLALSDPLWQGAIMAITVSLLRVMYDAKERLEPPELIPCERVDHDDADLRYNGDVWELKDKAIKLLDTCADQVDAQIKRSQSE